MTKPFLFTPKTPRIYDMSHGIILAVFLQKLVTLKNYTFVIWKSPKKKQICALNNTRVRNYDLILNDYVNYIQELYICSLTVNFYSSSF